MTILEIYTKYNIPPTLQLHQLRVAAVAKRIAENMTVEVNVENIIQACLVHDMGNIIKFSFEYKPESFQPEGVEYWKGVKKEFIEKYGTDEHAASNIIAKEIGLSKEVLDLVNSFGFAHADERMNDGRIGAKICIYSDMRVSPSGILPLIDRLNEGLARFKKNKPDEANASSEEHRQYLFKCMVEIERQIFSKCKIKTEDINDESIKNFVLYLKEYNIIDLT
jgi:hypothetical protein